MANPWILAARPPTLWAAVAPVLVGAGVAVGDGVFRLDAFAAAMLGAVAIQVAANFANDASDAKRGADTEERIGPTRAVSTGLLTPRQMWTGTWVAFGVAALAGGYLIAIAGWAIAAIGLASIAAALTYVGGPIPYGYRGLGEVFVFVFFGLVATVGSRFVHDRSAPAEIWFLAIPMGMVVTAILVANNVRDIETDAAVGKRTLAVMLGRERTRRLYAVLVLGAPVVTAAGVGLGVLPLTMLVALVLLIPTRRLVSIVSSAVDGPSLIGVLVGTARLQLILAVVLAVAAAIG